TFAYQNPYHTVSTPEAASLPDAEDRQKHVLQNVSLQIQAGETVAIVGPVGSGKSTLLRLLPRLLDVPAQTIFLDGQD
ncbi:ATP-binding cassette domain-containing protein, partial [Klebsiella pneumoniae]|nr:ATP-binding cassette domain-containing protein [Klebsiella pneumoniae]